MIAIFSNVVDAVSYSEAVHAWLIANRANYNADKWSDVYKSDTEEKWGVKVPVEQENVSLNELISQGELSRAVLKVGNYPDGWSIATVNLFPYPDLNIRVDISDTGIRKITKSPYKPLIDLALLAVNQENESGVTIWLSRLENEQMTAEQVTQVLESFGAQILTK